MDEATTLLIEGLLLIEDESEASITWAGSSFPCCGGPELGGLLLGMGGFRTTAQCTIVVRTSVFPEGVGRPREKQLLTYKSTATATGRALRIDSINTFREAFLILECNDPNQGA